MRCRAEGRDPTEALLRQHPPSRYRAALVGHVWNLAENIQAPGCGCDRRRARASPRLRSAEDHLACQSRCSAARCHDVHGDDGIHVGQHGRGRRCASGPAGRARRPGNDYPPARAGGSPATQRMSPVFRIIDGQQGLVGRTKRGWQTWTTGASAGAGSACR
jgi:hypothetical protein